MELLLRTNFDIPKPPGGVFDPLRYLSLGQDSSREEVRTTSATSVYEVARPILQGCHAIPTKLKILLDRALSALAQEEVLMIVSGCGWQLDDYQRGYKLKDAAGSPLDRWNMVTKQEEPLILQQFLLFRETRNITQQLVIQDLAERSFNPLEKREMERRREEERKEEMQKDENLPERRDSLLQMVQQPPKKEERMSPPPREVSPPKMSSPPRLNPSPPPPAKLASPPQNNQPAAPIFPRSLANGIPLPPSSMSMSNLMSNHFPMFPFPGLPNGLPNGLNQHKDPPNSSALNLTGRPTEKQMREEMREREEMDSDSGSRRSSIDIDCNKRANLPDDIGISFVSPTTGKKRVQCNVCMKTFCDKGALKIHFSAVHLREMHKCTMHGCNMMFSSRRSRNRHSANPNPKLHTPQVKRRISQNDGRTHPGPNLGMSPSPITPILPKEPAKEGPREQPAGFPQLPPGFPHPGMPGFPPGFPGLNLPGFNPFMPPDLKALQQDLQRFSDLSKLFPQPPSNGEQRSESESGGDGGNRKRKSQNPTKRPHLDMEESEHISSDSASDEGFPDPMMEDDDDDLGEISSGDDAA